MLQTKHFKRCIQTLDASFALLKQAEAGSVEYEVYRNATIKGFELVLETGGKLLGKYLKQFFISPAEVDRLYFKDVLRHAAKHGLLTPDEAGSPIGTTGTLRHTIMGKLSRKKPSSKWKTS